jgi:hypothetical protein
MRRELPARDRRVDPLPFPLVELAVPQLLEVGAEARLGEVRPYWNAPMMAPMITKLAS